MKTLLLLTATLLTAHTARASDICREAAESYAAAKAGVNDESEVRCALIQTTREIATDWYFVRMLCRIGQSGAAVPVNYFVRTELKSFQSPSGQTTSSCSGVAAKPEHPDVNHE